MALLKDFSFYHLMHKIAYNQQLLSKKKPKENTASVQWKCGSSCNSIGGHCSSDMRIEVVNLLSQYKG